MKQRGVSKKAITVIPKQYKSYRINNSEKDWLLVKKSKIFIALIFRKYHHW